VYPLQSLSASNTFQTETTTFFLPPRGGYSEQLIPLHHALRSRDRRNKKPPSKSGWHLFTLHFTKSGWHLFTLHQDDPETRRLWKKFQQVRDLPEKDQRAVIRLVNSLAAASRGGEASP